MTRRTGWRCAVPRLLLALGATALLGCSGDDGPAPDGGLPVDGASVDAGDPMPAPPAAPAPVESEPAVAALPDLTPCPPGWREVTLDGVRVCDPWPATGRETCGVDEGHFPGEPGCRRVGDAADGEGWPAGLPAGGVIFVREGAPAGGTGTRTAPFPTVAEGLAAAVSGTIVAVGAGRYDEGVTVPAGVTVWGASVAETFLTNSAGSATLILGGAGVTVRNLRIGGTWGGLWMDDPAASAIVRDVVVDRAVLVGVYVGSGEITLEDVVVRDTRGNPSDDSLGDGLYVVGGGATVEVRRAVLERNHHLGVLAAGASMHLEDVAVLDTQTQASDGRFGRGLQGEEGTIALTRCALEGNRDAGLIAGGTSELSLVDVVIRDTMPLPGGGDTGRGLGYEGGTGAALSRVLIAGAAQVGLYFSHASAELEDVVVLDVRSGSAGSSISRGVVVQQSTFTASRVLAVRAREMGLFIDGESTIAALADVTVREIPGGLGDTLGRGITVQLGAQATMARIHIEEIDAIALHVAGVGTRADVEDLSIADAQPTSDEGVLINRGQCIQVSEGGALLLRRAHAERCSGVGLLVSEENTDAIVEDFVLLDVSGVGPEGYGRGVSVQIGAHLEMRRARLERGRDVALFAARAGALGTVEDLVVTDTASREDGLFGRAIHVQEGAMLDVARALLERNGEVGVFAASAGSTASLTDVVVRDTQSSVLGVGGRALAVQDGARIELARGLLEHNREVSAAAYDPGGELLLEDIVIRGTRARSCAEDTCTGLGAGIGVGAYGGGTVSIERFLIESNALAGLQLARDGVMDALQGTVRDNPIGANVQTAGFDLSRITTAVTYRDNGLSLDSSELAIPDPSGGI